MDTLQQTLATFQRFNGSQEYWGVRPAGTSDRHAGKAGKTIPDARGEMYHEELVRLRVEVDEAGES